MEGTVSAKTQPELRSWSGNDQFKNDLSKNDLLRNDLRDRSGRFLRCPGCGARGDWAQSSWNCESCARQFPVHGSVVDFRVLPARADLSFAHLETARSEQERVKRGLALAATTDFSALVDRYFAEFPTSAQIERSEKATLLNADSNAREWLYQIEQEIPVSALGARTGSVLLEIGCGTAGISCALAGRFETVIALDADLDRLILAQKHCQDLGVANALLLCAFGEALPLAPDATDFVTCIEVLEHAAEQRQLLAELRRTLSPGGWLYLTTPNRFTLGREPHVHLWGVGWLPRRWMDGYVRFRRGLPYTGKRNLSYGELSCMLRAVFRDRFAFCREQRTHYTRQARLANRLLRIPGLRRFLPRLLAGFHAKAEKGASPVASTS